MKIAVLGAGVIGVSTAYYLARQGHDVTVLDRQHGPALETSFANAGEISPGYDSPPDHVRLFGCRGGMSASHRLSVDDPQAVGTMVFHGDGDGCVATRRQQRWR